jgi:hypothetical protein
VLRVSGVLDVLASARNIGGFGGLNLKRGDPGAARCQGPKL